VRSKIMLLLGFELAGGMGRFSLASESRQNSLR